MDDPNTLNNNNTTGIVEFVADDAIPQSTDTMIQLDAEELSLLEHDLSTNTDVDPALLTKVRQDVQAVASIILNNYGEVIPEHTRHLLEILDQRTFIMPHSAFADFVEGWNANQDADTHKRDTKFELAGAMHVLGSEILIIGDGSDTWEKSDQAVKDRFLADMESALGQDPDNERRRAEARVLMSDMLRLNLTAEEVAHTGQNGELPDLVREVLVRYFKIEALNVLGVQGRSYITTGLDQSCHDYCARIQEDAERLWSGNHNLLARINYGVVPASDIVARNLVAQILQDVPNLFTDDIDRQAYGID